MRRLLIFLISSINAYSFVLAQNSHFISIVLSDEQSGKPLSAASIIIYKNEKTGGTISNAEGKFNFNTGSVDSVKFSMIGYNSIVLSKTAFIDVEELNIKMKPVLLNLDEVVIRPMTAQEIVETAIKKTLALLPAVDFESKIFYREIIKDKENYFSVAEAIFKTLYYLKDQSFKLSMEKGRSKEDVSYTRLFEDYHPGGGPEALADKYLAASLPDFFNLKKIKWFNYRKESVTSFDGKKIYVISFDQKPGIHEALDKGRLFITKDEFVLLKYEAMNSPIGTPYIKNLTGTDKIFANLLNIEFKRKGWTKEADFIQMDGRLFLSHAAAAYLIDYKQPKKQLDLDLTISSELLATEINLPIAKSILKSEEWKRKNLVANLPTDFDANFWGTENVISPTKQVDEIIAGISKKNKEDSIKKIDNDWLYHQPNMFVAYSQHDSISLVPIMKAAWEDDETAGILFKEIDGDFIIESKLNITKRSDAETFPDNGFQQSGIIIRSAKDQQENNIILCLGTAGNSNAKIILRKTDNGKSKGPVDKIEAMNGWLRLEKKGSSITALYKTVEQEEWEKITTYQAGWVTGNLQVGVMVMARFAGSGPKMKPDIKATFTQLKINKE